MSGGKANLLGGTKRGRYEGVEWSFAALLEDSDQACIAVGRENKNGGGGHRLGAELSLPSTVTVDTSALLYIREGCHRQDNCQQSVCCFLQATADRSAIQESK